MELVSWGLLLIPLVILITAYFLGHKGPITSTAVTAVTAAAAPTSCQQPPTISTPESISAANKIISENNLCHV